jgi:hypothetical protein
VVRGGGGDWKGRGAAGAVGRGFGGGIGEGCAMEGLPSMGDDYEFGGFGTPQACGTQGSQLAPFDNASHWQGAGRFVDQVRLPGFDMDMGAMEVEMDDFESGLPTMGSPEEPVSLEWDGEEEALVECDVEMDVAAVEFYAAANSCPAHLSIVNYNEFAENVQAEVPRSKSAVWPVCKCGDPSLLFLRC